MKLSSGNSRLQQIEKKETKKLETREARREKLGPLTYDLTASIVCVLSTSISIVYLFLTKISYFSISERLPLFLFFSLVRRANLLSDYHLRDSFYHSFFSFQSHLEALQFHSLPLLLKSQHGL